MWFILGNSWSWSWLELDSRIRELTQVYPVATTALDIDITRETNLTNWIFFQASWQVTTTVSAALVSLRTAWQCALALGTASWKSGTNSTNHLSKQNCPEKEEKHDENLKQHQHTHTYNTTRRESANSPETFRSNNIHKLAESENRPSCHPTIHVVYINGEPILFNRGLLLSSRKKSTLSLFFKMAREKMSRNKRISKDTRTLFEFDLFSYCLLLLLPPKQRHQEDIEKKYCAGKCHPNRSIGTRHQNLVV